MSLSTVHNAFTNNLVIHVAREMMQSYIIRRMPARICLLLISICCRLTVTWRRLGFFPLASIFSAAMYYSAIRA